MKIVSTEYRPIVLPPGKSFHDLGPDQRLRVVYGYLDRLRQSNGGYVCAPGPSIEDGDGPGYDLLCLRDLMLASTANEYLGEAERLLGSYALVLQLLEKFHHRIIDAILEWPPEDSYDTHLFPNRYHARSLAEIQDGENGHQGFVLGLMLYKLGDLMKHGFNLVVRPAEIHLVKDLVQYVHNSLWQRAPDQGFWAEDLAVHATSIGAVLAGLTMWQGTGYYDFRYPVSRDISRLVPIPDRLVAEGREALMELLPAETADRETDMAQLSLLWPFNILRDDPDLQDEILGRVEGLAGERGLRRFDDDALHAAADGHEAEWPMGFAWMAIVLAKLVFRELELGRERERADELLERASAYMERLDAVVRPDGCIPEYYSGDEAGPARPFGLAHGLYVSATVSIRQSRTELVKRFG